MKRPALQNKWVAVLLVAFRARKLFGTFVKRAPGFQNNRRYLSRNGARYRRSRSLLNFVLLLWRAFGMGGESGCQV